MDETNPIPSPAPIQSPIMGYDWQVVRDGVVLGHYRNRRTAEANAAAYPGSEVRPTP